MIVLFLAALALFSQFRVVKSDSPVPIVSFDMTGMYVPTRIIVQFGYCPHVSGPLNMTTLSGTSLPISQISPISFEFYAREVDTYEFDLHLEYNASTFEQVIQLAWWSGTLSPNSERYKATQSNLWIHFKLVTSIQPVIPSKEEIAEQVVIQVKQDLADYQYRITLLTMQFEQNMQVMWAVLGASIVSSILSLVVSFYAIRSAHQEKRR